MNAHTTASNTLWAGLPVLTCTAETFVGRVAGSLLHAVGPPELVTGALAEYEALALRLALQPGELAALRARLAANRATALLFDIAGFTRHLEVAHQTMWRIHAAGEPPRPFAVQPAGAAEAGDGRQLTIDVLVGVLRGLHVVLPSCEDDAGGPPFVGWSIRSRPSRRPLASCAKWWPAAASGSIPSGGFVPVFAL